MGDTDDAEGVLMADQVVTTTVELDVRELRALRFAGSLIAELFADQEVELPDGRAVTPLDSGCMKLETALIVVGEDDL